MLAACGLAILVLGYGSASRRALASARRVREMLDPDAPGGTPAPAVTATGASADDTLGRAAEQAPEREGRARDATPGR